MLGSCGGEGVVWMGIFSASARTCCSLGRHCKESMAGKMLGVLLEP